MRITLPKLTASSHWPSSKTCSRLTLATIQSHLWTTTEKKCFKRKIFNKVGSQSLKFWTDLTDKAMNKLKKMNSRTTMMTETINNWMMKTEMTTMARITTKIKKTKSLHHPKRKDDVVRFSLLTIFKILKYDMLIWHFLSSFNFNKPFDSFGHLIYLWQFIEILFSSFVINLFIKIVICIEDFIITRFISMLQRFARCFSTGKKTCLYEVLLESKGKMV